MAFGPSAGRRVAAAAALAASAFVLGGCFDVQYDITLKNDGGGTIATRVIFSKEMSQMAGKGEVKRTSSAILKNGKAVTETSRIEDGRLIEEQTIDFQHLSDVTLPNGSIEVVDAGRSLLGVDTSHIRLTFAKKGGGPGAKPLENNAETRKIVAEIFAGHFFTVAMHVPCTVESASSFVQGGTTVAPMIDKSFIHGSTVHWQIPMAALADTTGAHHADLEVTCWSWMGIPAGKTKS